MGMPPPTGGRHWIRPTGQGRATEQGTVTVGARTPGTTVDGAAIAEFAYAQRWDLMEDTAPIPVTIPGPRAPLPGRPTFRIDAAGPSGAVVEQDSDADLATVAVRLVAGKPVFVDESGRRKRWLALVGASAVTICAAYVAVVGVSVLHGTDIGPVGTALAGLLPPTVTAEAPDETGDPDSPAAVAGAAVAAGPASVAPRVAVVPAAEQVQPTSLEVAAPPTSRKQAVAAVPTTRARTTGPKTSPPTGAAGATSSDITTAPPPPPPSTVPVVPDPGTGEPAAASTATS